MYFIYYDAGKNSLIGFRELETFKTKKDLRKKLKELYKKGFEKTDFTIIKGRKTKGE